MKILVINASLSGTSTAKTLDHLKFSDSVDVNFINLKDLSMSFADGRDYREYENDNKTIVTKMIEADAIVIGSPTYQASIPGVLKNLFDLLPINAIANKPIAVVMTAGSSKHYLVASQQLLPILNYLKSDVLNKYVFVEANDFTENKLDENIILRLETLSKNLEQRVEQKQNSDKKLYSFLD